MKKYNMIENRKNLTREEVEKGMDFNKIIANSNTIKSKFWKPAIILFSILTITIAGWFLFFNTNAPESKTNTETIDESDCVTPNTTIATETYSLFFGNKLAFGQISLTKEELGILKSLDLKSSIGTSNYKLKGFTFTTLTNNGISQINVSGGLFSPEIKAMLKTIKVGQTLYFENIVVEHQNGEKKSLEPITVLIK
jgi:hypothetical protein